MRIFSNVTMSSNVSMASNAKDQFTIGSELERDNANADEFKVWANASFYNDVTIGSSSVDIIEVKGQLTASSGLHLSSSNIYLTGSSTIYYNGVDVFSNSGGEQGSGGIQTNVTKTETILNNQYLIEFTGSGFAQGSGDIFLGDASSNGYPQGLNALVRADGVIIKSNTNGIVIESSSSNENVDVYINAYGPNAKTKINSSNGLEISGTTYFDNDLNIYGNLGTSNGANQTKTIYAECTNGTVIVGGSGTTVSGSSFSGSSITLTNNNSLPSVPVGSLAVSGSKLYFYGDSGWKEVSLV